MVVKEICHLLIYFYLGTVVLCNNRQDVVDTLLFVGKSEADLNQKHLSHAHLRQTEDDIPFGKQPQKIVSLSEEEQSTQRVQARVIEAKRGACQTYSKSPGICVEEIKCEAVLKGKYFPKICNIGKKVGVCCKIEPTARANIESPTTRRTTSRPTSRKTTNKPTRKTTRKTTRKPTRKTPISTESSIKRASEDSLKTPTVACGLSHLSHKIPSVTDDPLNFISTGIIHPRSLFQEIRSLVGGEQGKEGSQHWIARSIVGGELAEEGSQPWIVAVGLEDEDGLDWVCGGTLITMKSVLTGAHCTEDMTLDNARVMVGNNKLDAGQVVGVDGIFIHPGWEHVKGWPENDLAVFRIRMSQDHNIHVAPICLSSQLNYLEGESGVTSGWGNLYSDGPRSENLQSALVSIKSKEDCKAAYPFLTRGGRPPWDMLCAAGTQLGRTGLVADSCQGDSGGPLVVERGGAWHLAGVVAGGLGCGDQEYPGVYVDVAKHMRWIAQFL